MGRKLAYHHRSPNGQNKGWYFGIPNFDVANNFVYAIESLRTATGNSLDSKKRHVADAAVAAANNISTSLMSVDDGDTGNIRNALDFLKTAANAERRKEAQLLKNYKDKLKAQLPKNYGKDIDAIIKKIDSIDLVYKGSTDTNKANFQADYDAYVELVEMINFIRKGYEETLYDLQRLKKHRKTSMELKEYREKSGTSETKGLFSDLYKDDVRFIGEQNIISLLKESIGADRKVESMFGSAFRNAMRKYTFTSENLHFFNQIGGEGSSELQAALLASIGTDILQLLQEELRKQGKNDFTELDNIEDIIKQYYDNLHNGKNLTRFQQDLLYNWDECLIILDRAIKEFGIKELQTEKEKSKRKRQIAYRKQRDSNNNNTISSILTTLGENRLLKNFQGLNIKVATKTSHGNFNEFFSQFTRQAISDHLTQAKPNGAADAYAVGSVNISVDSESYVKYINARNEAISNSIAKIRKGVADDQTKKIKDLNDTLENIEKTLVADHAKIQKINVDDKLFLYEESFKLSKSAEVGIRGAFHGRAMQILNYIDTMYSIPDDVITLPDKKNLYFLALNLSRAAIGDTAKDPLVTYFSVFAGLLMFEDVAGIAKDISEQASQNTEQKIHLYKLNGVYVPASFVLSYTYTTMEQLLGLMDIGKASGFRSAVQMDTRDAVKNINEVAKWTKTRKYPKNVAYSTHWYNLADKVASGTIVKIAFLSGFLKLIDKLTNDLMGR